jgi:hypothetical protein
MENKENKITAINIKEKTFDKIIMVLLVLLVVSVANNQIKLNGLSGSGPSGFAVVANVQASEDSVIPVGNPKIYGNKLGISYDDVSPYDAQKADATINIMANIDRNLVLEGKDLRRYIDITSRISCEYCCGAKSIIVTNEDVERTNQQIEAAIAKGELTEQDAGRYRKEAGVAACGCAHSYAMRGLAKYLVKEHGNEFTDDEVLEELGKWKALFFPGQIQSKAKILSDKGVELSYINLASNKYRGIEQGSAGSGMVGGC